MFSADNQVQSAHLCRSRGTEGSTRVCQGREDRSPPAPCCCFPISSHKNLPLSFQPFLQPREHPLPRLPPAALPEAQVTHVLLPSPCHLTSWLILLLMLSPYPGSCVSPCGHLSSASSCFVLSYLASLHALELFVRSLMGTGNPPFPTALGQDSKLLVEPQKRLKSPKHKNVLQWEEPWKTAPWRGSKTLSGGIH